MTSDKNDDKDDEDHLRRGGGGGGSSISSSGRRSRPRAEDGGGATAQGGRRDGGRGGGRRVGDRSSNRLYVLLLCTAVYGAFQIFVLHRAASLSSESSSAVGGGRSPPRPNRRERNAAASTMENVRENDETRERDPFVAGNDPRVVLLDEQGATTATATATNNGEHKDEDDDGFFRDYFHRFGVRIDDVTLASMPSLRDFERLYGEDVVLVGTETCADFRSRVPEGQRVVGPAGTFNTGTNLATKLINSNCRLKTDRGVKAGTRFQVPWGKHSPVNFRNWNVAIIGGDGVVQDNTLPVVMVKDPYTWMASMCRHSYSANWRHTRDHCPNLLPNDVDLGVFRNLYRTETSKNEPVKVRVRYKSTNVTLHDSLVGLWNDWYGDYAAVNYPRLIVRYEDMLLRPERVVKTVCDCVGGDFVQKGRFRMTEESAKGEMTAHRHSSGLLAAVKKYGDAETRRKEFKDERDLDYARAHLRQDLMKMFGYSYII